MTERTICYCFGYSFQDIRDDLLAHGRSTIMDKIAEAKRTGSCHCESLNPKGR